MTARDPLFVTGSRECPACENVKRRRKACSACDRTGYEPNDTLRGAWSRPGAGFLVCGGPSLKTFDLELLRGRGVVSLAINNAAGYAPVTAWTFSDPQYKFHWGQFTDPKVITFCPAPKLCRHVRVKVPGAPDGFEFSDLRVQDCPNTWGYSRKTVFDAETFLTTPYAHWGFGGKQGTDRSFTNLNTMFLGLRLLCYLGLKTIFLVGVDFNREPGSWYAWAQDKGGGGAWHKSIELCRRLRPVFEAAGISVYNCNPESRLTVWPHHDYEAAIAHARGPVPPEPFDLAGWYEKGPVREARERMKEPGYQHYSLRLRLPEDQAKK